MSTLPPAAAANPPEDLLELDGAEAELIEQRLAIPTETAPDRADKILSTLLPDLTRARWQKLLAEGHVWREGGEVLDKSATIYPGETILYAIPAPQALDLTPANIPLEILFEDEHLVAINKAPGMVAHPGAGTGPDTVVHALLYHCKGQLAGIGGVERPGIVHRLDKETSGVMVVAKSEKAFQGLSEMFRERTLEKEYLALVAGGPSLLSGSIEEPIARHPRFRLKMTVAPHGRPSHTDWERVERVGTRAGLLRLDLHTGRTHQIRVHLAHKGWPILGDSLYGWKARQDDPAPVPRVMLHAARLALPHPVARRKALDLRAPLPADFAAVRDAYRKV